MPMFSLPRIAAYTDALLWYLTRDDRYARKSIQLMDAWSATIQDHTNSNAPLQTAWSASSWPKAAEIIKYEYGDWPNAGRFATMLRTVYVPEIINGSNSNGNWELSMTEALQGIGVFLEDKAVYDKAIALYRLTDMPHRPASTSRTFGIAWTVVTLVVVAIGLHRVRRARRRR